MNFKEWTKKQKIIAISSAVGAIILIAAIIIAAAVLSKPEQPVKTPDETTLKTDSTSKVNDTEIDSTLTETSPETEPTVTVSEPTYMNPLTGWAAGADIYNRRPVSIMVNNIDASLPQSGISQADIIYECLAEGGITRLMMISTEYGFLPKVGSVRSARDYYIDWAESYDCIFVHAGGSTYAYDTLYNRGTDHIDGVQGPSPYGVFAREQDRLNAGYAYEHTLFIQGGYNLLMGVQSLGYRQERSDAYSVPVNHAKWGEKITLENKANHIGVNVSNYQYVDYIYNAETNKYERYQYHGQPHIDSDNGEIISFENVILLYNDCGDIAGDTKSRIWMQTTGEGKGYYITNGTYTSITWKKASHDAPIKYYYGNGTEVALNRGRTMINVIPNYNYLQTVFDNNTEGFTHD